MPFLTHCVKLEDSNFGFSHLYVVSHEPIEDFNIDTTTSQGFLTKIPLRVGKVYFDTLITSVQVS